MISSLTNNLRAPRFRAALLAIAAASLFIAPVLGTSPAAARSDTASESIAEQESVTFGPKMTMELGAIDFQSRSASTYQYVTPGGVVVTSGGAYFHSGLRLPVGARILSVEVFLDPNGQQTGVLLNRYNPLSLEEETLASAVSTNGSVTETVLFKVNRNIKKGWNYRIDGLGFSASKQILYGARLIYRLPV
jgi:hypothetical protein